MLFKCPGCGAHVPNAVAVEIRVGDEVHRYCSVRCAEAEESEEIRSAPLPPLPEPPKRLLVAVDGSGPALRAVQVAASLAQATGGEVRILNAVDSTFLRAMGLGSAAEGAARLGIKPEEIGRALEEDAEVQFERCRRICAQAGVHCETVVEFGAPLEVLKSEATRADLVVIGSRGRGALSGALIGSLSQRVIGGVEAPVLVVH